MSFSCRVAPSVVLLKKLIPAKVFATAFLSEDVAVSCMQE